MARNERDNSGDITGGRDSLGVVHPLSVQEQLDASLALAGMTTRWAKRSKRSLKRRAFVLEELLLMAGLKEEPSEGYQRSAQMREIGRKYQFEGGGSE